MSVITQFAHRVILTRFAPEYISHANLSASFLIKLKET